MANEIIGRKRVRRACDNCRALKTKCDGTYPNCARCAGYGYQCKWHDGSRKSAAARHCDADSGSSSGIFPVGDAVRAYESLICWLCERSSEAERAATELRLSLIRSHLPEDLLRANVASTGLESQPEELSASPPAGGSDRISRLERYHGEASDVQFYNAVKQMLGKRQSSEQLEGEDLESYEQEDRSETQRKDSDSLRPPLRQLADKYVDVFFSTIHIAYPFVYKPHFFQQYKKFWQAEAAGEIESSNLALIYIVFAIGSYYTSFPSTENTENHPHKDYCRHAQTFLEHTTDSRNLGYVCALLAQCFYLLAVSQTERCWTTLGLAVRAAQSIGLHVEHYRKESAADVSSSEHEVQRRTWYCLYVLDRLLALQLGRPPAIHEAYVSVELPRRLQGSTPNTPKDSEFGTEFANTGLDDYFIKVIQFSRIIEQVMLDLYNPFYGKRSVEDLLSLTSRLDERLTAWKRGLPRTLRFDLGHTFEKSVVFQRQRNMLAIKYHHLRALIHRPFLCYSSLRLASSTFQVLSEDEHHRMGQSRGICVSEAQHTAHLLHKVSDERTLVQDFPWWQMISCLICASSILLVASARARLDGEAYDTAPDALDEDAETCLKVFEALSVNSDAARLGRNMMRELKEAGLKSQNGGYPQEPEGQIVQSSITKLPDLVLDGDTGQGFVNEFGDWQLWPGEISESMTWSARFVDATYNPFLESM